MKNIKPDNGAADTKNRIKTNKMYKSPLYYVHTYGDKFPKKKNIYIYCVPP